jgi:hypothetical protein
LVCLLALSSLPLACHEPKPLGPTPLDEGIVVFMHSGFRGTSQQINADVPDLTRVQGPCGNEENESARTWNDCISSIRLQPGWGATLYGDKEFRGGTLEITGDVSDLDAVSGSCKGSFDDCVSSIRVFRR